MKYIYFILPIFIFIASCSEDNGAISDEQKYELFNKHEYSIIEAEYYSHKNITLDKNYVRQSQFNSEYKVAFIKTDLTDSGFAVALVNPKYPPYQKSFPVDNIAIPDEMRSQMEF